MVSGVVEEPVDVSPEGCAGAVLKQIVTPGHPEHGTPGSGCRVTVHYTGKLTDGTVFDSSRDRNSPFEFQLGKRKVIKGWDVGVATMHKGEVAVFTIREDFAYGESGSPPKIPPKATLIFEVELIEWEIENLSGKKDRGILRTPITPGVGFDSPKTLSEVKISLKGEHNGRVFDDRTNLSFHLGQGPAHDIPTGVEKALESFTSGETSKLELKSKYGFGSLGHKTFEIPPDADLLYTVTLHSFEQVREPWTLSQDEKIEEGGKLKEKGTEFFKKEQYEIALKMYLKAIECVDAPDFEENLEPQRKSLFLTSCLNAAMCYLKLDNALEAKKKCDSVLEIDPNNVKALFRRGQALLSLAEPQVAKVDFEKVLGLDPSNKAAAAQIHACATKLKEIHSKERKMYANMFEKFAQKDREGEKPQVEIAPENPEIAKMSRERIAAKKKYIEDTKRYLEEKRRREEEERKLADQTVSDNEGQEVVDNCPVEASADNNSPIEASTDGNVQNCNYSSKRFEDQ